MMRAYYTGVVAACGAAFGIAYLLSKNGHQDVLFWLSLVLVALSFVIRWN